MAKIRTRSGRLIDPFNPTREDVNAHDMMHSICLLNRFTGHTKWPYPVGQHTRNLVRVVPAALRRAAFVHDLGESWFNDVASPVKAMLPEYKEAEERAMWFIAQEFNVTAAELREHDYYDKAIYVNERDALFDVVEERGMGDERTRLNVPVEWFAETPWRVVRDDLELMYATLFPELQESQDA